MELQRKLQDLRQRPAPHLTAELVEEEIRVLEKQLAEAQRQIFSNLSAWQRVQLARHPKRPYALDYIAQTFTGFNELH